MAIENAKAIAQAEAARRGSLNDLGNLLRDLVSTLDSLSDAEVAFLDGVTAGTVSASKAVVVDADKDVTGFRNVTATGSFIIGSADMDETDLEKLDGITNGTQAAGKAVVADANVNTGVSKVTELHIGASGSEVQVTATPAEINAVCDVSGRIVTSTDAGTLALVAATHGDRIVYFNDADGTITLPNATGSGVRFHVVLAAAATNLKITVTPDTDEEFAGGINGVDDDADAAYAWKAEDDDDTITLNGTSQGGKIHDWVKLTDIATGIWLVEGFITQSGGSEATPFSADISAP